MQLTLSVDQSTPANPGDTFTFMSAAANTQYHFQVSTGNAALVIGIWKGDTHHAGNGVARNKPGVPYVDHVCGLGQFVVTVEGVTSSYVVSVKANSWWKKVFGWG